MTSARTMDVQELQKEFDRLYWRHEPGRTTIEHTYLHLQGLMGEFSSALLEPGDQADLVRTKIVPGLISHALRLANDSSVAVDALASLRDHLRGLAWETGPPKDPNNPLWGNPPGCSCEYVHKSNSTCRSQARSRGAIKDRVEV